MTRKFFSLACILLLGVLQLHSQIDVCNGFEDAAERAAWTLVNGSQTNQWVMSTAVNNGGSYSLYISNSPTSTVPAHSYTISTSSNVWAYIDVEFPECDEDFTLSFDWLCYGESCCDYIYLYIGEATVVPTAGSNTAPTGATQIQGPNSGKFNLQSSWQHFSTALAAATYAGQVKRIFFLWHNDSSVGTMPAGAIDNFCINECVPCDQPVVAINPSSAIVCSGESVTLTASASGGAGNYTYQWSPSTGLSSTNTATTVASPNTTTTYTLRVTDGANCPRSTRVTVEVAGTTLSVSASPQVYCRGTDPVTLNANLNVVGSCSDYSFRWSNGGTGSVITDVPQQTTTYTVTATPADPGCCTLTASYEVTVNDCNNECSGFETAGDRAEWTFVNGTEANQWVMSTATNHGGQYAMYVSNSPTSATPPNAYTNTASTVWAYKEFEFPECDDDFVLSFDWKCGGESSCDYMSAFIGEYVPVTAGSNTQPTGTTRLLNLDATSSSYQNYFNTYGNYNDTWHHCEIILNNEDYSGQIMTLYFMWHNDGSVQNYSPIAIDNVCMLTCVPCDQPVVTVQPASLVLCHGESATITASATGGSGTGYTYTWTPEATCNPTTGETVTVSPEETTIYRVRVEDSEGCAKTVRIPAEISSTRLTLTANPPGFCNNAPEPVTITANLHVEGSCSSYTYSWNTGAVGTSIVVTPNLTTTYSVTATPTDPSCCELTDSVLVAVMDCQADGCPSVTPAELGTNNVNISLDCASQQEVTLSANVIATAVEADDYFVISIPYNPPYGFTDGTRIFANAIDDIWNTAINLPFTFCFYGQTFTQIVAGANSVATFNAGLAGSGCTWLYNESIPSPSLFPNCIFACYRDIHPSTSDFVPATGTGGIFEGVLGEYPCRSYVLTFNNIKLYSCTEIRTFSTMIVLYEGTNIIDIYVRDAPTCLDWNDGNGLIGIQNADGTRGVTPPGRNTGPWTAHNEAWRFMPTGQPQYDVTWYSGTDTSATGTVLGRGDLLTVLPEETSQYTARLQYTACNGDYFDIVNTCQITVNTNTPDVDVVASKDTLCWDEETTISLVTDTTGGITYEWNNGETGTQFTTTPDSTLTTYSVTVTFDNGCSKSDSLTVYTAPPINPPVFTSEPASAEVCAGECVTITSDEHFGYLWSTGATTPSIHVCPQTTTNYALTISDEIGCTSSAETQVIVHPNPVASFSPEQFLTFLDEGEANVHFIDNSTEAFTWLWDFGDIYSSSNSSTDQSPDHIYTMAGIYTVYQYVTSDFGCSDSTSHQVSIQKPFYFYVPNAFTPDGDGINEVWLPRGEGVDESNYICTVYDRFGRLVFSTNTLTQGWDGTEKGKKLPMGSYVYVIQTATMDDIPKEFVGTVTLIR